MPDRNFDIDEFALKVVNEGRAGWALEPVRFPTETKSRRWEIDPNYRIIEEQALFDGEWFSSGFTGFVRVEPETIPAKLPVITPALRAIAATVVLIINVTGVHLAMILYIGRRDSVVTTDRQPAQREPAGHQSDREALSKASSVGETSVVVCYMDMGDDRIEEA